jgi:hypothetical protein
MHRPVRLLAFLLLIAALLGFAARAAAHDHAGTAQAGDTLCALCVYGGASLGGTPATAAPPIVPCHHARPAALPSPVSPALQHRLARIRAPPATP